MNLTGHRRNERGVSLLECMVYVAMLCVLMGLSFEAYGRYEMRSAALRKNSSDIIAALHAGEMWRQDIREANGEIRMVETNQVVRLYIPQSSGDVCYSFEKQSIHRLDQRRDREILARVKNSRMERSPREHVNAWRWELELNSHTTARTRPLFTFEAVDRK